MPLSGSMDHEIRPLTCQDEPILWEMLYYGLSSVGKNEPLSRDVVRRPEISRYVEGWGRIGDSWICCARQKKSDFAGRSLAPTPGG